MTMAVELELPLGDGDAGELADRRMRHLTDLVGSEETALRLAGAFPSLRSIYGASEDQLGRVVGTVAAARIRWFLDAPLRTGLTSHGRRPFFRAA